MRRIAIFVGPVVAAAVVSACENDDGTSSSLQFPEAGGFDSSQSELDSSLPDAATDVVVPPQPVTVVVTNIDGTAMQGITVVFHDASGAVLETKQTAADGKAASTPSQAPAMATVVFGQGSSERELLTWTGVQGGDVLPVVAPPSGTLAEVEITIPGRFTGTGGPTFNYYAQVGGCQAYSTIANEPIRVFVEPHCYSGAGAVLVAGSNTNDVIVAHASKKPVTTPTDGGVVAVTTDPWSVAPTDVTVSITNTNDGSGSATFSQITNQTAFPESKSLDDTYQASFRAVSGSFVEAYNASVVFTNGVRSSRVLGKRVLPTGTITFDATQLPPALTAAAVDPTSKQRPTATWTGNVGAMKGGLVRLHWWDSPTESSTLWTIVVPANNAASGAVTAPALPADFDEILPSADGGSRSWETTPEVSFVDSDIVPDYATWRKLQGVIFTSSIVRSGNVERTVLPQNGGFRITNWHPHAD